MFLFSFNIFPFVAFKGIRFHVLLSQRAAWPVFIFQHLTDADE